ncbi:MAG TPA: hypothetical protein VMV94_05275 [Phycisphaerae bacterium]|nr:hypothetical protein [Phycisphaerae bacterium]
MLKWIWAAGLLAAGLAPPQAAGEVLINLEWRPAAQTAVVGGEVDIGLYAVCDQGESQLFRAADVVFTWSPTYLHLIGLSQTGAVPLLSSVFPAHDPYGLNEVVPPQDGDGYYRAFANLGSPVTVTDVGSLLTTFRFTALTMTPLTIVDIADSGGSPPPYVLDTRVLGGSEAGTVVTGTLGSAGIEIVPEPATFVLMFSAMVIVCWRR